MFEIVDNFTQEAVIKVIGVGGGGGNAVSHMLSASLEGVDFICANTDVQALNKSGVDTLLPIGVAAIISGVHFSRPMLYLELPYLFILTTVVLVFFLHDKVFRKHEAAVILAMYLGYAAYKIATV